MTIPSDATFIGIQTAACATFLGVCAWHNHRIGYRKVRPVESPLNEALRALNSLSSSSEDTAAAPVPAKPWTEQLACLESALQRSENPVVSQPSEAAVAEAEVMHTGARP